MIVIDHKNDIGHENLSKAEASRIIGVCWNTIHNWSKAKKKDDYHHFTIYFVTVNHKQPQRNTSNNRLLD